MCHEIGRRTFCQTCSQAVRASIHHQTQSKDQVGTCIRYAISLGCSTEFLYQLIRSRDWVWQWIGVFKLFVMACCLVRCLIWKVLCHLWLKDNCFCKLTWRNIVQKCFLVNLVLFLKVILNVFLIPCPLCYQLFLFCFLLIFLFFIFASSSEIIVLWNAFYMYLLCPSFLYIFWGFYNEFDLTTVDHWKLGGTLRSLCLNSNIWVWHNRVVGSLIELPPLQCSGVCLVNGWFKFAGCVHRVSFHFMFITNVCMQFSVCLWCVPGMCVRQV